jgi:hypothetical protein
MSFFNNDYFWRAVERRAGIAQNSREDQRESWSKMFGEQDIFRTYARTIAN